MAAIWEGDADLVSMLFESGNLSTAPVGGNKINKIYPISQYVASVRSNVEMLHLVKRHCNPPVNAVCGYFGNALRAAVWGENLDVIKTLIDWGASINGLGIAAGRPLCLAVTRANIDVIRLLLKLGADPILTDDYGQNALLSAACALSPRSHSKTDGIMKLLLEHALDGEELRSEKSRALCFAARKGNVEAVRHLLENGADPNASAGYYSTDHAFDEDPPVTAIDLVLQNGNVEIVKLFLQHGSKGPIETDDGALINAIRRGHKDLAFFFIGRMADNKLLDNGTIVDDLWLGLFQAVKNGELEVTRALLHKGARFGPSEMHNVLHALRDASHRPAHADIIELLIDYGLVKPSSHYVEIARRIPSERLVDRLLQDGAHLRESAVEADEETSGFLYVDPWVRAFEEEIDVPLSMKVLNAGAELEFESVVRLIHKTALLRDMDTLRDLLDRFDIELPGPYNIEVGELDGNGILIVLHTAEEQNDQDAARLFLESCGPEVVAISELFKEKEVRLEEEETQPYMKLEHATLTENVPLLKFLLTYYSQAITQDLKELMTAYTFEILEIFLKYYVENLNLDSRESHDNHIRDRLHDA